MRIGLIDVDGHNFPSLPLMKISAYHKQIGDSVEWYEPLFSGHMDKVYMSKVFSFTEDYEYFVDADEVEKGGTGYFYPDGGESLLDEIEHIYPDYSIYHDRIPETKNTAYIHFAWDRYEEKEIVVRKLKDFQKITGWGRDKMGVYVLCNFNTEFEQDLERVYTLRELGYAPYIMLYDKQNIPKGHRLRRLQRWVNNRIVFNTCARFEDYDSSK